MARRRRKKPYVYTFELAIFSEYVFCLYFYLCICVLLCKGIFPYGCINQTVKHRFKMYALYVFSLVVRKAFFV